MTNNDGYILGDFTVGPATAYNEKTDHFVMFVTVFKDGTPIANLRRHPCGETVLSIEDGICLTRQTLEMILPINDINDINDINEA